MHPYPKRGQLVEHIPEPLRSKYFLARRVGETIFYDAPDYAHARAMRADTFPPDGGFPGTDPDLAFRQLILEAGADIGILLLPRRSETRCFPSTRRRPRLRPTTGWPAVGWTAPKTGTDAGVARSRQRFRTRSGLHARSSTGPAIQTWRRPDQGGAATLLGRPAVRPGLGGGDAPRPPGRVPPQPRLLRRAADAARGATVVLAGLLATYSLLAANQVMSLIFDGVFERFPTLQVVFVEHAFTGSSR